MKNGEILKEIKRVFIPKTEQEKQQEKEERKSIASPIFDGRKFIGSGEDANIFTN
jgi:hypothetical protein